MAKERGGPRIAAQLLYYPVSDAGFDTGSYHQFAENYWLRRDAMLRDEGEAYAAKLRSAGVPVTAVCYQGAIHDFVIRLLPRRHDHRRGRVVAPGDALVQSCTAPGSEPGRPLPSDRLSIG